MSDEVTMLKAWQDQGCPTDEDGTPIPPREEAAIARVRKKLFGPEPTTSPALPGGHTDAREAISEGAFSAEQIDAGAPPMQPDSIPRHTGPKCPMCGWEVGLCGPDDWHCHSCDANWETAAVFPVPEPTPTGEPEMPPNPYGLSDHRSSVWHSGMMRAWAAWLDHIEHGKAKR